MTDREIYQRIAFALKCYSDGRLRGAETVEQITDQLLYERVRGATAPMAFAPTNTVDFAILDPLFRDAVESIRPGDQAVVVIRRKGSNMELEGQQVAQFGFAVSSEMTGADCMQLLNQGIVLAYERMKGTPQKP